MPLRILALLLLLAGQSSLGQAPARTRNVIWTIPVSKTSTINGLAIGLVPEPVNSASYLHINGVNISATPLDFIWVAYAFVGTLTAPFHPKGEPGPGSDEVPLGSNRLFPDPVDTFETRIKGLSLTAAGAGPNALVEGVSLNGVFSSAGSMRGIECSGMVNIHYDFRGLMIAGLRNKTTRGKGVQIALFNNCKAGRVIQLGLINRIGNRTLPLMNFSLRKQG